MADKRIIELTEKATVDNSDYLIIDNSNGGTKKLQIATLLGSIDKLKKEVVQTLPIQDIDENTIYLVPKQTAGTQNVYDEYMYINNAWELIGSTEVDLTNYQTKTDNDLLTTSKQIVGGINELFQSVSSGKAEVASAITDKGVTTASDATFSQMATNIGNIQTGITPTGTKSVTISDVGTTTEDVTNYADVEITTSGLVKPSGTRSISSNGTYDVSGYQYARVSVSAPTPSASTQSIASTGTVTISCSVGDLVIIQNAIVSGATLLASFTGQSSTYNGLYRCTSTTLTITNMYTYKFGLILIHFD